MNLDEIRKNYENYDDSKIELIASTEAFGLVEGVAEILKDEIKKRKLSEELLVIVDAQTKDGILKNSNLIRKNTCPSCKSKTKRLNATIVGKVYSVLVFTNYEKQIKIGCTDCLDNFHKKAMINSALFGWWGIPWGPIHTISSLFFNKKMKKIYKEDEPNEILKSFVAENAPIIKSIKDSPNDFTELLNNINQSI